MRPATEQKTAICARRTTRRRTDVKSLRYEFEEALQSHELAVCSGRMISMERMKQTRHDDKELTLLRPVGRANPKAQGGRSVWW
mmetsp:Transcript_20864/g.45504  ORF Transcript_20864/g.45504 Transcript_20864/m.45504 type:complete len:84 (+) Transcript_20864:2028-2279(+)